jgi:hypothetical protein
MQNFRNLLTDCQLEDLGFSGDPFTWKRGRVRERLDRALANRAWMDMNPDAMVQHLEYMRSDHRPILLDTDYVNTLPNHQRSRKFEAKWLQEETFNDVVKQAWDNASEDVADGGVHARLEHMHAALHAWDASFLKKPRRSIRKAQRRLEKAMSGPITDESELIAKETAALIELLLEQEEMHWMQRSRANWLQYGDRNTSFFHQFATARRKRNLIKKLKHEENWVEGTAALKPLILHYFANLFTSKVQDVDPDLLDKVQPKVTQSMNEKLLAPFLPEDVKKAAFSIGDLKAPGPDGLHAIFYKNFGLHVVMISHARCYRL